MNFFAAMAAVAVISRDFNATNRSKYARRDDVTKERSAWPVLYTEMTECMTALIGSPPYRFDYRVAMNAHCVIWNEMSILFFKTKMVPYHRFGFVILYQTCVAVGSHVVCLLIGEITLNIIR